MFKRTALPRWSRIVREPLSQYEREALEGTEGVIRAPADVAKLLQERAAVEDQEVFWVVLLNAQNRVLAVQEVTRGTLTASLVHPREVFRLAVAYAAAGIVVAHNHPGGDPTPSAEDRAVTRQLVESGRVLDIPVYDHLVLTGTRYFSFSEGGLL